MKNCSYFNRIRVARMAALAITLPFQMLPVAEGTTQPENIEVSDISCLCVRFAGVGETGIGKPIGTSGETRYELSGSAITVNVAPVAKNGEAAILIDGKYGQVKLHAKIVLNVGAGTETITTVSPYVFRAIAAGGGGGDYKTDMYMDGVGRVILERMEDGSTVLYDEHENPIVKRNADGSTEYFDAYQSVRMSIDANGNVTFNGDVSGAGMEQYILTLSGGKFHHGDEELNFAQIKAAVEDVNKFVYLDFANAFHLPSFMIDTEGRQAVAFVSSFIIGGETHIERVIINEQELIATDNAQVLRINEDGGVVFGDDCEAYTNAAFAHGSSCHAEADYSHAEGADTTASGNYSHAEGADTTASGNYSHAEGESTTASGDYSHAEGENTTSSGYASHAEGENTTASGDYSHAEGESTTASGGDAHAEGENTTSSGYASHAEGADTTASGNYSHAEGNSTSAEADYSHAEGNSTTASGDYSHAEGENTTSSGYASHAEGNNTEASGDFSHAEGSGVNASGFASHAEGNNTEASGNYSHAEGMFNNPDDANAQGSFSHGCGTSDNDRKNAFLIIGSEVYVYGLGGYNGTNHESAQSLRQIIQALQVKTNNL